jgi:hypothetical protein
MAGPGTAPGATAATGSLPIKPDIVVASDGSGDFTTIQSALESIPRENRERRIVLVRNGTYREKLRLDAPCVTLHGESRDGTRIEFAQGADDFKAHPDELGIGVINLSPEASDAILENFTVVNTHGVVGPHAFTVFGRADRTIVQDCNVFSDGADTLSLWRERVENAPVLAGQPSLPDGGRYYHARLNVRGSVDFVCPRGWCYMVDSTITQVNPGATAAVWHDGSRNQDMKFVMRGCRFAGPPGWILARHHADAQFYFVDCTFSAAMRDRAPYRVIYPLNGGNASEADTKRNAELAKVNQWGERSFYYNAHREGGDYPWHADNLASAPVPPAPEQVNASWTFGRTWDPERSQGPRIRSLNADGQGVAVVFTEVVTVKGQPRLVLPGGRFADYVSGSGTETLSFAVPAGAATADPTTVERLDLKGGTILATEASSALLFADLALPAPLPNLPAFPGAEGFGANTPGGRGGKVLFVTNLNDSGPGSLRAACEAEGPRTVLFRVSGTIQLKSPLIVRNPWLTLAGQTAPGDGICLRDYTFGVATHDVIVRYLRFRLGDETAQQTDSADLFPGATNCIFDHCSATWSIDECLSLSGNIYNVTVQWCLIGEPLHHSKHAKGAHGLGSLSRATGPVTWHHNLWLHTHSRNPRLGDNYGRPPYPLFDVRNNVVYNYISSALGLTQGRFPVNYVGNYLRPGLDTKTKKPVHIGFPSDLRFFIDGNVLEGDAEATTDNRKLFSPIEDKGTVQVHFQDTPFAVAPVRTETAGKALERVLEDAGATLPRRDSVDTRLVAAVRTHTGHVIDSQTQVGGWPELRSEPAAADADDDGMPDAWEQQYGLNAHDAADGAKDEDGDGYTNLEEFLNGTDPLHARDANSPKNDKMAVNASAQEGATAAQVATKRASAAEGRKDDAVPEGPDPREILLPEIKTSLPQLPSLSAWPVQAELPDPLVRADGTRVTNPADWPQRREEIRRIVEYYAVGRMPPAPGNVTGREVTSESVLDGTVRYRLVHLTFGPDRKLALDIGIFAPAQGGPFPVVITPAGPPPGATPLPRQPPGPGQGKGINALLAVGPAPDAKPMAPNAAHLQRIGSAEAFAAGIADVFRRGYACVIFNYSDCGEDTTLRNPDGSWAYRNTRFFPAYPGYDWGLLGSWAWGVSRIVDYLVTDGAIDPSRIIVSGVSRTGKSALVAGAFDQRIALTAPVVSGGGGVGAYRFSGVGRGGKEGLGDMMRKYPNWFSPHLRQFWGHTDQLPFDQHWLIAMIAPRGFLALEGTSDPVSLENAVRKSVEGAAPVYELLGAKDKLAVNYEGHGHAFTKDDWEALMDFADSKIAREPR